MSGACVPSKPVLVGDRVFLEAFLKYGCNAEQIGCMDTAYEEICFFQMMDFNFSGGVQS